MNREASRVQILFQKDLPGIPGGGFQSGEGIQGQWESLLGCFPHSLHPSKSHGDWWEGDPGASSPGISPKLRCFICLLGKLNLGLPPLLSSSVPPWTPCPGGHQSRCGVIEMGSSCGHGGPGRVGSLASIGRASRFPYLQHAWPA